MIAFKNHGFLHSDLHLDNILFKPTNKEDIDYGFIKIKTEGFKIIIMDFEMSFVNIKQDQNLKFFWNDLLSTIYRIYDIKNIRSNNLTEIVNYINIAINNNFNLDKSLDILQMIDNLNFERFNMILPQYDPTVY